MRKKPFIVFLLLSFIMMFGVVYAYLRQDKHIPLMPDGIYDFPSLYIYSELDPFDVERELWHDGLLSVRDTSPMYLFENIRISLRGRGNSSWERGLEKRPLRIRFEKPHEFLNSGYKAQDWVLIANLFDPSVVRNDVAFYFADLLYGMDWTPFSQFVHLYVNDEYYGVYQLVDELDVGPERATLIAHPDPKLSEYFIEIDGSVTEWTEYLGKTENIDFFGVDGRAFDIKFPKRKNWNGHLEYVREFIKDVNDAIYSRDYELIKAVIDMQSFLDFYLTMELFKNVDVGQRSMFIQIRGQGEERKLYFGPVWDFDRSSGNMLFWRDTSYIFAANHCPWFKELVEVPEIFDLIRKRWVEVKNNQAIKLIEYITYLSDNYEEAFQRNFLEYTRIVEAEPEWLVMLPDEIKSIDTYSGQINYFLDWIKKRIEWLDGYYYSHEILK